MYLYDYRELIKNLVISDLKTKYSNSILGFAWSMINPLAMLLVLFFVFSNVFKNNQVTNNNNFVLYLLIGLVTWRFFANGTVSAMNSIVGKPSLVTKIYLPREILTLSAVLSCMISSALEFLVLLPLLLLTGVGLYPTILLFPLIHVMFFLAVYGLGLILASFYVYYRDLNQIWEVAIQAGFFVCPIVYAISFIPDKYQFIYSLNPIVRLMDMYRDIFLYGILPVPGDYIVALLWGALLIIIGSITFSRLSRRFAEAV